MNHLRPLLDHAARYRRLRPERSLPAGLHGGRAVAAQPVLARGHALRGELPEQRRLRGRLVVRSVGAALAAVAALLVLLMLAGSDTCVRRRFLNKIRRRAGDDLATAA